MKKFKPILFSTEMVQALLAGRKIQTRRVMKPQPNARSYPPYNEELAHIEYGWPTGNKKFPSEEFWADGTNPEWHKYSPYGKPGDILWVRETYSHYRGFGEETAMPAIYLYKADLDECLQCPATLEGEEVMVNVRNHWKPSIHMPKSACRIWLEITNIRVERLQDISEKDAVAEGVKTNSENGIDDAGGEYWNYTAVDYDDFPCASAKESFETLWCSINGEGSWDANPWVWVIEFKRIEKPESWNDLKD